MVKTFSQRRWKLIHTLQYVRYCRLQWVLGLRSQVPYFSFRKHQINILKDKKNKFRSCSLRQGRKAVAWADCRKWLSIFGTQSACPVCCGGFKSQSLPEYHLLHTVTRSGRRSQAEFHYESLDITFISQITRKHKREKEPTSELSRVRDRRGERTCTTYREILA